MKYILFFILFLNSILFKNIFSEDTPEYYWEQKKESLTMNFAASSELKVLGLTAEDFLKYNEFVEKCMQGKDNSIIVYFNRKKLYIFVQLIKSV